MPLTPVGKMVLNRNPDNFFAETEQVAFCTAHIVPGIDFTNDPLLQGRIHSYLDTQISRLGGPNFHEIPINSPVAPVQNNQRDGMHRQAIHRGRVTYEPNSLGGGCPFQAGMQGFTSFPQPIAEDKVRGKAELFADHYSQARLFWESQTPVEQAHIIAAFRFELTRVQTPAVRERVVSMLANVNPDLAAAVGAGLGLEVPKPLPLATELPIPQYPPSPALSLLHRPGEAGVRTRRVAVLVAPGVDGASVQTVYASLLADGAVPRLVGSRLGKVTSADNGKFDVEITFEAGPSVLYDAMVVPDGEAAVGAWRSGRARARFRTPAIPPLQADPGGRLRQNTARQGQYTAEPGGWLGRPGVDRYLQRHIGGGDLQVQSGTGQPPLVWAGKRSAQGIARCAGRHKGAARELRRMSLFAVPPWCMPGISQCPRSSMSSAHVAGRAAKGRAWLERRCVIAVHAPKLLLSLKIAQTFHVRRASGRVGEGGGTSYRCVPINAVSDFLGDSHDILRSPKPKQADLAESTDRCRILRYSSLPHRPVSAHLLREISLSSSADRIGTDNPAAGPRF